MFTVLAALSGMEREYICDRTLEGHKSARTRGKSIGGASVTDDHLLSRHCTYAARSGACATSPPAWSYITKGKEEGQNPSPATILRLLREHDEATTTALQPG